MVTGPKVQARLKGSVAVFVVIVGSCFDLPGRCEKSCLGSSADVATSILADTENRRRDIGLA